MTVNEAALSHTGEKIAPVIARANEMTVIAMFRHSLLRDDWSDCFLMGLLGAI